MRTNGIILFRTSAGEPSTNEDGEPVAGVSQWSEPVECWIQTNTHNEKGAYADGKFTQAAYTVLIEEQPIRTDRVRLTRHGEYLGEFAVQDTSHVTLDRVKLTVTL